MRVRWVVLAATLLSLAIASPANAVVRYGSSVRIKSVTYNGPAGTYDVAGKVRSPKPACVPHRTVTVYVRNGSQWSSFHDIDASSSPSTTNTDGSWTAHAQAPIGAFQDFKARVAKRVLPSGNVCKAADSPIYTVPAV